MALEVQGNFVSEKVSKVRWIPEDYGETKCFLTGSWDNNTNTVKVWSFETHIDEEDADYPRILSSLDVDGDVTDMRLLDKSSIIVSSSEGDVKLLLLNAYDRSIPLKESSIWRKVHRFGQQQCSCTSVAVFEGEVATAGEDGRINVLKTTHNKVARTIDNADSCSIHCVCYLKHNEVITGNLRGHMKIWDLRSPIDKPSASFLLSGEQLAATALITHPTQRHLVLAGSESGSLAVWDLRNNTYPASLLTAHTGAVGEMQFHPNNPQRLFTCSANGEIWDWNTSGASKTSILNTSAIESGEKQNTNPWLSLDDDKNNMEVSSLMNDMHKPINTLDCDRNRVLCGCDNEAVYLIKNVNI